MKRVSFVLDERSLTSDLERVGPHHKIKVKDAQGNERVIIVPKLKIRP